MFEKRVLRRKRQLKPRLKLKEYFYCPIFECIKKQLYQTKLTFKLEEYGAITPMELYEHISEWIFIGNLISIDLTSLYNVKYFGCNNANYEYDFRAAMGLRHLAIEFKKKLIILKLKI